MKRPQYEPLTVNDTTSRTPSLLSVQGLQSGSRVIFAFFWLFDSYSKIYHFKKARSLEKTANFATFENLVTITHLSSFLKPFFPYKKLVCEYGVVFSIYLKILILRMKRLYTFKNGQFSPFSKCSLSSNITCFLERRFAHNNSNVLVQSFFAPFCHF